MIQLWRIENAVADSGGGDSGTGMESVADGEPDTGYDAGVSLPAFY